jgi:hypothetical protein
MREYAPEVRSKDTPRNSLPSGRNPERLNQTVHPLQESRRTEHWAKDGGRNCVYLVGSHKARLFRYDGIHHLCCKHHMNPATFTHKRRQFGRQWKGHGKGGVGTNLGTLTKRNWKLLTFEMLISR